MKDIDPNIICDKMLEVFGKKPVKSQIDVTMYKVIWDELLRTENITQKQYNNLWKNLIGVKIV